MFVFNPNLTSNCAGQPASAASTPARASTWPASFSAMPAPKPRAYIGEVPYTEKRPEWAAYVQDDFRVDLPAHAEPRPALGRVRPLGGGGRPAVQLRSLDRPVRRRLRGRGRSTGSRSAVTFRRIRRRTSGPGSASRTTRAAAAGPSSAAASACSGTAGPGGTSSSKAQNPPFLRAATPDHELRDQPQALRGLCRPCPPSTRSRAAGREHALGVPASTPATPTP